MKENDCEKAWAYTLLKRRQPGSDASSVAKRRGPKPRYNQTRLREIMAERDCTIAWAYKVLREENEQQYY